MMGWQDYVVAVLLLLCVCWIGRRLWFLFQQLKKKKNPCSGCAIDGCALKKQLTENESVCSFRKKKERKSCCI